MSLKLVHKLAVLILKKKRWYFSCFEIVSFVISTGTGWKKKKSQNLMNIFSTFVYVG